MWTDHTEYKEYQKLNAQNSTQFEKNQNKYWDIFFQ